jgi:hypothetical protein
VGATQQFTATGTYSESTTQDITTQVTWSSSSTATATIVSSGLATGVAAGTATITAALSGQPGTATLTITDLVTITDLIAADRITAWNPEILSDGQLGLPLGADGLPERTTVCATLSPGANIQAAIDSCPAGQVVQLNPGTFSVSSTITLLK